MDCGEHIREWLEDRALGIVARRRSPDELALYEAHLAGCARCRREYAQIERLVACAARLRALAEMAPAASVAGGRRAILDAVQVAAARRQAGVRLLGSRNAPGWAWTCASCLAAAAAVLVAAVLWVRLTDRGPSQKTALGPGPAAGARRSGTAGSVVAGVPDEAGPGLALGRVVAACEAAAAFPADTDGWLEAIRSCEELRAGRPGSPEAARALRLLSDCYAATGEQDRAREAFLAYAAETASRAADEARRCLTEPGALVPTSADCAGVIIRAEAERLLAQNDHVEALFYFQTLIGRLPGGDFEASGHYGSARCFEAVEEWDRAVAAYTKAVGMASDSCGWKVVAWRYLSGCYLRLHDYDKALAAAKAASAAGHTPYDAVYAEFLPGLAAYRRGDDVAAVQILGGLVRDFQAGRRFADCKGDGMARYVLATTKRFLAAAETRALRSVEPL